jgi:hypothetical protein
MSYNSTDLFGMSMGAYGHEVVTDGSFSDRRFAGFIAREESVVTFKDYSENGKFSQKTSETYPANYVVVGDLRDLTVFSGRIDAYNQKGERTADAP